MTDKDLMLLRLVSAALQRADAPARIEITGEEVRLVATERSEHHTPTNRVVVLEPGDTLTLRVDH